MSKRTIHDGIGSVELLETFGNDLTVVNAARVSFAKESNTLTEADKKLIRYLARNNHISPFFHPQIRFRIKMPIFVAREWYRHTIGLARNEVSRRYVDTPPECWIPETLRARDPKLKQGSKVESIPDEAAVMARVAAETQRALDFYGELLTLNVAPEVARGVLPQSMYTEFIETGSLAAYARICQLRLDPHAQKEIRDYAGFVADLLAAAFPVSWAALLEGVDVPAPAPAPVGGMLPTGTANAVPAISPPATTPAPTPAPVENTVVPTADYTSWGC